MYVWFNVFVQWLTCLTCLRKAYCTRASTGCHYKQGFSSKLHVQPMRGTWTFFWNCKRPYQERGCKVFEKITDQFKMNFFLWSTNPFFHCFCSCRVLIFNIADNLAFSVSFDPLIGLACISSKTHNLQAIFSSYLVPKPCMFCEESLGLELFDRNSSVQEFYSLKALIPLEQVNTWVVEKKILISKRRTGLVSLNFIVCKWVLWWACSLFSRMIEWCAMLITFLIYGNDVISLESRPLNFHVFKHTYSLRPQRYLKSSLKRVLNQFRNK